MRELIPKEYNVLSITGGQKNERELEKMCNYDVLIYNSAISAGHSIDIKDHFDSVFLVVNSPTPNGRWVTARIDEMFQMAARVRNPITKKIYITTDTFHYKNKACTVNGDEEYYSAAMKSGFDILMSGRNIVPNQLAAMCKSEFEVLVLDWITTKAFPGSIITEEYLNGSQTAEVVLNNDHVFSIQADQFHLAVIEDSLSNPKKYIDCVAGVRRRKAVPVDVFYENEEHIAALKALPYIEYFDSKRQVEVRMLQ
ncbi:replication origin-binding protein [Ostreid herpesvirus 1]|nr:replication origin-binding protein [Ostreid herpesvirus 1]UPX73131.1 replication origin-binding protein [Ostreid herpesvirus 1]UPX73277.1 replication origin-binding protein [Ostreid herpesvirus 1]UPX73300.1 replication origin-binding protein [Ostreid herpesvirus 1]UPX73632.1 replication origin-binding protein [Ostreid herpesvirus 1]